MFDEMMEHLQKIVTGLERGIAAVTTSLPLLVRQEISTKARSRLDTTYPDYMEAVHVHYEGSTLVVELDPDAKLANMLETGVSAFDMKVGHLQSDKAKMSKQGWRYMSIPIPHTKTGRAATTDEGKRIQTKIREALKKPTFGGAKLSVNPDGTIASMEQLVSSDPELKGLYRVRRYASSEAYKSGQRPKSSQFVLFRTMSEKPNAKGKWEHPGLRKLNAFGDLQVWVDTVLPGMIADIMDQAIKESLR